MKKIWMPTVIIPSLILGAGINLCLISSDIISTSKTIQVKADTVHNIVSYVSCEWNEEEKCVKRHLIKSMPFVSIHRNI